MAKDNSGNGFRPSDDPNDEPFVANYDGILDGLTYTPVMVTEFVTMSVTYEFPYDRQTVRAREFMSIPLN